MKITVLIENSALDGYEPEHGLSLYIEHRARRILLDSGATNLFIKNADLAGAALSKADAAVLSHAHYDHSGGFDGFFDINPSCPLYLNENCICSCYSKKGDTLEDIGIPKALFENRSRLRFTCGFTDLHDGIYLLPHTSGNLSLRGAAVGMTVCRNGKTQNDDFSHEQTLIIDDCGLYIFSSCSHAGVVNILNEVRSAFPCSEMKAFFGGFHLMGGGGADTLGYFGAEAEDISKAFKKYDVRDIYTGHCTGTPGYALMEKYTGSSLHHMHTGSAIEL